jgi:hypothetical protein
MDLLAPQIAIKPESNDVLIVALRSNLRKVYSDAQIAQLDAKVQEYRSSLSNDGLGSTFIYLDDANTSSLVPRI